MCAHECKPEKGCSSENTIWTALNRAGDEFRAAGVDAPRLTAEVLLAHVLGWERARIIAHLHDPLAAAAREQIPGAGAPARGG